MLTLAFTSATVTSVSNNPRRLLSELHTPNPIKKYFAQQGWQPVEPIQNGATFYFGKGKQQIIVRSRPFTARYRFYEVIPKPEFQAP
jgi:hypothetical protein